MSRYFKAVVKISLSIVFISIVVSSCDKSMDLGRSERPGKASTSNNGNAAAAHIIASEKMMIPAAVQLPASSNDYFRIATYYAVGVQRYKAKAKNDNTGGFEWVFVAPSATLYNIDNVRVGTHGAGPFWEISPEDSLFAEQFVPARIAPSEDPESIDWLLLKPKTGKPRTGIFSRVQYIQRIATKGGKPPVNPPISEDEIAESKYQAVYRFSTLLQ